MFVVVESIHTWASQAGLPETSDSSEGIQGSIRDDGSVLRRMYSVKWNSYSRHTSTSMSVCDVSSDVNNDGGKATLSRGTTSINNTAAVAPQYTKSCTDSKRQMIK